MFNEIKVLIWCMGDRGAFFAQKMLLYPVESIKVIGFTDTKVTDQGTFYEYPVYSLEELEELLFDYIVIACDDDNARKEIKSWIIQRLKGNFNIVDYKKMLDIVRTRRIIQKYEGSEDVEIKETVEWLKKHSISVRNQRENSKRIMYEVLNDELNGDFPYVHFMGKRMYFPKNYNFIIENDKRYLTNIVENDQYDGSPHLYIHDKHRIERNDVIVDAGVAEGNFALSYIDIVSKIYLIESSESWLEALQLTFAPFKDKVILVPKMLSDEDTNNSITLDTLLQDNKVNFVKMDIEGAEAGALLGGINTLKKNDVKLSICAYHRQRDAEYIRFILESLGYKVSYAQGYMFFLYDNNIDETLDFRHGVIYGQKV